MKQITKLMIRIYQKFFSVFSYGSCRYYPTCSQYAIWQLENNSFFKAIYFTIIRILKCNQLFKGGFDYPQVNFQPKNVMFKKINVKYWYVPIEKNNCLILKNWEWTKE